MMNCNDFYKYYNISNFDIVLINSFDSCSARENPTVQEAVGASGYVRLGQQGPPK